MNTALPLPARGYSTANTMSWQRLLRTYATEAKYELVHVFRSPNLVVFTLLFPVMFYLLAGTVFGLFRSGDARLSAYVFIGFAVMATMTPGFTGFGVALAIEREKGLHTLRRALPMPAAANVVGKTIMAVVCVGIVIPALIAMALLFGHVTLTPAQMVKIGGLALVGALPFCALGFFIGMHVPGRAAQPIVNIAFIPMLYLSGAFVPLPPAIAWVAALTPPFYLQQLMLGAAGNATHYVIGPLVHWAVLAAVTVVFAALTVRRFRIIG
jgi:ABC-2 type transport system permease protein